MDYWRLDYLKLVEDQYQKDFFLCFAPSHKKSKKIRAYHLELLYQIKKTTQAFYLVEADNLFIKNFPEYYENISKRLKIDYKNLTSQSRHEFFIAAKQQNGNWISGLEILMGYDFPPEENSKTKKDEILVTTGDYELDLIAELHLHLDNHDVQWLIKNYSSTQLNKIVRQISDRRRGAELIEERRREKDKEVVKSNPKIAQAFPFPDASGGAVVA